MRTVYLSVIIPAYNESENFKNGALDQAYEYLQQQGYSFELILVDDGSDDQTLSQLQAFAKGKSEVQVVALPHRGKAPTVRDGMLEATGKYRLFTDFDQSTPISEIEKLIPFLEKGYDIVIGSREVKGSKREHEPWHRHLMGKGFNLVVKIFTVRGIQDTQCGFKLLTDEATKSLFPDLRITVSPKTDSFTGAFDVELLFLASKRGMRIAEVPVHWKHRHTDRVNPVKDSMRMFADVLRVRLASLTGKYA